MFDGVHLGHQQVIRQAVSDAHQLETTSLCITFDQHPAKVISPETAPLLIQNQRQKLDAIKTLGIESTLLLPFDEAMSKISGEEFIRGLSVDLGHISSICVGSNFAFGHQRSGNLEVLKQLGHELNFTTQGLASVSLDEQTVSSTRIRKAISNGHLDAAGQMMGREYALSGIVIPGDQQGRQLGFPTANLNVKGLCTPPRGVYAAHAEVNGKSFRAAVNIGLRPTLKNPHPSLHVEAHILDFAEDIYEQICTLNFVGKLRDEQDFGTIDDLKAQIEKDVIQTQYLFTQL
jgi:riboflavin kinase/FMN adenylyltransferase